MQNIRLASHAYSHEISYNYSHVRVKNAGLRFDDAGSSVVGRDVVESALRVRDNRGQSQSDIPRVHLIHETVAQLLLLTSRNLNPISRSGQVPDYGALFFVHSRQSATDKVNGHGSGLPVGERNQRARRVTVDKLHAEDLSIRERSLRRHGQCRRFGLLSNIFSSCSILFILEKRLYVSLSIDARMARKVIQDANYLLRRSRCQLRLGERVK